MLGGPKRARVQAKVFGVTAMPGGASTGMAVNTWTVWCSVGVKRRRAVAVTGARTSSRGPVRPRRCQRASRSPRASWATNSMVAVPSSTTVR
ncbi:hypothetical protein SGRI78S_04018 [Streptomyces griseus subsp. griseus]